MEVITSYIPSPKTCRPLPFETAHKISRARFKIPQVSPNCLLVGGWTNPFEKYERQNGFIFPKFWGENSKNLWVATTQFRSIRVEDSGCQRIPAVHFEPCAFFRAEEHKKKKWFVHPPGVGGRWVQNLSMNMSKFAWPPYACFWHGSTFGSGSVIICWAFNLNKSAAKTWGWNESLEGVVDYLDVPGS